MIEAIRNPVLKRKKERETFLKVLIRRAGAAMNAGMTVVAVCLGVFMDILELLVAFIQAYVFTMLSAVFIGLSRQDGE